MRFAPQYHNALEATAAHAASTGVRLYLTGIAADSLDAIAGVYAAFPTSMALTAVTVLLFTGAAFRSALIPLRAVFTIGLTIAFVYGVAICVYQRGALDWSGWPAVVGGGAVFWLLPVAVFAILVGLSLDYDIFLLVRVREAYLGGRSARDAVIEGLYYTGPSINCAGVSAGGEDRTRGGVVVVWWSGSGGGGGR